MLKVTEAGRRRGNSFSVLLEPVTPTVTPSSSLLPGSLLEARLLAAGRVGDLLRATEQVIVTYKS